jgi:hypothetical protein
LNSPNCKLTLISRTSCCGPIHTVIVSGGIIRAMATSALVKADEPGSPGWAVRV